MPEAAVLTDPVTAATENRATVFDAASQACRKMANGEQLSTADAHSLAAADWDEKQVASEVGRWKRVASEQQRIVDAMRVTKFGTLAEGIEKNAAHLAKRTTKLDSELADLYAQIAELQKKANDHESEKTKLARDLETQADARANLNSDRFLSDSQLRKIKLDQLLLRDRMDPEIREADRDFQEIARKQEYVRDARLRALRDARNSSFPERHEIETEFDDEAKRLRDLAEKLKSEYRAERDRIKTQFADQHLR
jgi:chromosome segregation ATPase